MIAMTPHADKRKMKKEMNVSAFQKKSVILHIQYYRLQKDNDEETRDKVFYLPLYHIHPPDSMHCTL